MTASTPVTGYATESNKPRPSRAAAVHVSSTERPRKLDWVVPLVLRACSERKTCMRGCRHKLDSCINMRGGSTVFRASLEGSQRAFATPFL